MHPPHPVMLAGTLIPLLSIVMGGLLLIIPVAGITVRFALKPALETLARVRELQNRAEETRLLERRLALLEQQLYGAAVLRVLSDDPAPSPGAATNPQPLPDRLGSSGDGQVVVDRASDVSPIAPFTR